MMKNEITGKKIPDRQTCLDLLSHYTRDEHIINHCKQVCSVALDLAYKLQDVDVQLNLKVIEAGALLHDICRKEKSHSIKGAALMSELGYDDLSNIILWHMELPEVLESSINEITLVYLADKKVIDDKIVTISERFSSSLKKNKDQNNIDHIIQAKYLQAQRVEKLYVDKVKAADSHRVKEERNV